MKEVNSQQLMLASSPPAGFSHGVVVHKVQILDEMNRVWPLEAQRTSVFDTHTLYDVYTVSLL